VKILREKPWGCYANPKPQCHKEPIGRWTACSMVFARLVNGVVFPDKADKSIHVQHYEVYIARWLGASKPVCRPGLLAF
jgi:hypothetical protein